MTTVDGDFDREPACPMARDGAAEQAGPAGDAMRRWILAGAGVALVGIGAVGVFVPGLPTTIFLIIASICFTKSCPWLEQRLIRTRLFAPYLRYVDGEPIPMRGRITALIAMWLCVSLSLAILYASERLQPWLAALIVGSAGVGTVMILRWRREPRTAGDGEADAEPTG
ncbi:MAG: YbaN family protein [Planctomycetota bacterium]|jgi:uncharacterized membrane protein YbaN (DUF454 family)